MKLSVRLDVEVSRQDIEDIFIAGKEGMIGWGRMEPDLSPEEATERMFRDDMYRVRFVDEDGNKFSTKLDYLTTSVRQYMEDPENHAVTIDEDGNLALNMDGIDNDVAWNLIEESLDGGEAF